MESVLPDFPIVEVEQEIEQPSLTYKLDLDAGRIVGMVDGKNAVEQAIRKALITPRFKCLIYDNQYGSELKQGIIAEDATPELIQSDIPRMVRDALSVDARVLDVRNFEISMQGDEAFIRFEADTVFGTIAIAELIR